MAFKNTTLTPSRHKLDEAFYKFIDSTRTQHDVIKRFMSAAHQKHLVSEIKKARSDQEDINNEALVNEHKRVEQLTVTVDELTSVSEPGSKGILYVFM